MKKNKIEKTQNKQKDMNRFIQNERYIPENTPSLERLDKNPKAF